MPSTEHCYQQKYFFTTFNARSPNLNKEGLKEKKKDVEKKKQATLYTSNTGYALLGSLIGMAICFTSLELSRDIFLIKILFQPIITFNQTLLAGWLLQSTIPPYQ